MKKQKIKELMAIPDLTEEIDGGDFFDDDNLVHQEEEYVEGVQVLSRRHPDDFQNSGHVLQGSSEVMNYDYQQESMGYDQSQGQFPSNSQMQNFHNSRPNPNYTQPQSGINYNMMQNNQSDNRYY
jgi:hypothetical protein